MPCDRHSWWFSSPCPKCAALEQWKDAEAPNGDMDHAGHIVGPSGPAVAPAVEPGTPYVEPSLPDEDPEDTWALPAFLQRRPEGGWMYPSLHGDHNARRSGLGGDRSGAPVRLVGARAHELTEWTDEELLTAIESADITLSDRQPIIMEARRREDRQRTYARLEKANFLKGKKDP